MCEIAIEDDKKRSGEMNADYEVMNVLRFVLDSELDDKDLLSKFWCSGCKHINISNLWFSLV
jgi:hypothetical protein